MEIYTEITWGKVFATIAGLVGICIGVTATNNFISHYNKIRETPTREFFQKIDGINSYTEFEVNKENGSVTIKRISPFGFEYSFGEERQGIVDKVSKWYIEKNLPFNKVYSDSVDAGKDFLSKPEVLEKANKEFKEQIERFESLRNKSKSKYKYFLYD